MPCRGSTTPVRPCVRHTGGRRGRAAAALPGNGGGWLPSVAHEVCPPEGLPTEIVGCPGAFSNANPQSEWVTLRHTAGLDDLDGFVGRPVGRGTPAEQGR
jgi:hypothetical protein